MQLSALPGMLSGHGGEFGWPMLEGRTSLDALPLSSFVGVYSIPADPSSNSQSQPLASSGSEFRL